MYSLVVNFDKEESSKWERTKIEVTKRTNIIMQHSVSWRKTGHLCGFKEDIGLNLVSVSTHVGQQDGVPALTQPTSPLQHRQPQNHQDQRSGGSYRERSRERRRERARESQWRCKPDWWRRLRRERLWQTRWLQTQWPEYHRASWELLWRENHVSKTLHRRSRVATNTPGK